jgi:hypothetical protein
VGGHVVAGDDDIDVGSGWVEGKEHDGVTAVLLAQAVIEAVRGWQVMVTSLQLAWTLSHDRGFLLLQSPHFCSFARRLVDSCSTFRSSTNQVALQINNVIAKFK